MKKSVTIAVCAACWLVLVSPLAAHHGRGATYDVKQQRSLTGTVAEVLWRNPHIVIFLDAPDEHGAVVRWAIEHSNISTLARQGYGRTALRAGDDVTVVVYPGSDGAPIGLCVKVVFPDGREIFGRSAGVD